MLLILWKPPKNYSKEELLLATDSFATKDGQYQNGFNIGGHFLSKVYTIDYSILYVIFVNCFDKFIFLKTSYHDLILISIIRV